MWSNIDLLSFTVRVSIGKHECFQLKNQRNKKKTNMKLLIITACLLAYVATYPVSQLEDNKEIAETADKITESIDETLPPQNG